MATFQGDLVTDATGVFFDATGYGFGVAATLKQTAGSAAGVAVTVVPIEQTYNIFDSKQNTQFRFAQGAVTPKNGDVLTYLGDDYTLLDVKIEEGVWVASGMREGERQ